MLSEIRFRSRSTPSTVTVTRWFTLTTSAGFFILMAADVAATIRDGSMLSEALSKYPKLFPVLYVDMVRAGESSGRLDTVLTRLAEAREQEADLRRLVEDVVSLVAFKAQARGEIRPDDRVVVISTAHGLKFTRFKVAYHDETLADVVSRSSSSRWRAEHGIRRHQPQSTQLRR